MACVWLLGCSQAILYRWYHTEIILPTGMLVARRASNLVPCV